jgi:NAD(P)-dependent dehydrogenase (short-subunit alcohol dehydrogenase family)
MGEPFGPSWTVNPQEWWRNLETNLKGPFLCCGAVLKAMTARGYGRIVNVASVAGTASIPYMSAYVTSKTALIRFTEVLADELRDTGISVFAIHPGAVRTAMTDAVIQSGEGKRWLPWFEKFFDGVPDNAADAAAELVVYLATGAADALSGRFFSVPGTPTELVRDAEVIRARELHVLRIKSAD